jgi:hypothetical protein
MLPITDQNSPLRISVEKSGLKSLAVEHGLLFDITDSVLWLRSCRAQNKATIQANLPLVVATGSLIEAVLSRCLHEVVIARHRLDLDAALIAPLVATRNEIEGGDIWATKWIATAKRIFPVSTHPNCNAFLNGSGTTCLLRFFDLRNLAAHGASVWTDFRLPSIPTDPVEFIGVRRKSQQPLLDDLALLGFTITNFDGVGGLTELFSRNDIVDAKCRVAWNFFRELSIQLKFDSLTDWLGFHNSGILWPRVAEAFIGHAEFL